MKTRILTAIYFVIGLIYLFTGYQDAGIPREVIKALIIPTLIAILLANLKSRDNRLNGLMFAGLLFSWAGDIILDLPGGNQGTFIAGLASFLLAHVMYLSVFITTPGENLINRRKPFLLLPVIIAGLMLVGFLYKDLDGMRFPVIMYATVILTMLAGAINRKLKVNRVSYLMVLAGAILFVISDSTIAINKFSHPFQASGIVIMSSYIAAQYLILTGYLKQFKTP